MKIEKLLLKAFLTNSNDIRKQVKIETDGFFNHDLEKILCNIPYSHGISTLSLPQLYINIDDYTELINGEGPYFFETKVFLKEDIVLSAYNLSFKAKLYNPTNDLLKRKNYISNNGKDVILKSHKLEIFKNTIKFNEIE